MSADAEYRARFPILLKLGRLRLSRFKWFWKRVEIQRAANGGDEGT